MPDSAVSIGSRLRALAVYLVICQHVPVERCRELIADVTGAAVSAGFIHSCLAAGAAAVADAVTLIRVLITAAPVAGFDETTLRAGPAGVRKYVLGAFTERHSAFHLGARTLASFHDFAILDGFAGIVVSDRYVNFHDSWKHITGHQACAAHLLRFEDAAQSWSVATWPAQAQRTLRALTGAWHKARDQDLAAIPDATAGPLTREFRHAVLAGLSDLPRIPGPKGSTAQHPGRDLLEFCKHREDDVLRFTTSTPRKINITPRTRAEFSIPAGKDNLRRDLRQRSCLASSPAILRVAALSVAVVISSPMCNTFEGAANESLNDICASVAAPLAIS